MEKNKWTFISIIILLIICVPATIIGIVYHFKERNPNHEFYFKGELYFYNGDFLVGNYLCENPSCDYAIYEEIGTNQKVKTQLLNNRYAFIQDGAKIKLIKVKNGRVVGEYDQIYNYPQNIQASSYLVLKDQKKGLVSLTPTLKVVIEPKYDDLYLIDQGTEGVLSLDNIIVKEGATYKLLDRSLREKFSSLKMIKAVKEKYLILQNVNKLYEFVDYNGNSIVSHSQIKDYQILDKYLIVKNDYEQAVFVWTANPNEVVKYAYSYLKTFSSQATFKFEAGTLFVYENGREVKKFNL